MTSVASISIAPLLLALLLAITQKSRGQSAVNEGLLNYVPAACMQLLDEVVLPCAIDNLCFTLIPTDEEIASIADGQIESCADLEAGVCPITSRCPACSEKGNDFFKCAITNTVNYTMSENIIDLINGCSLDCPQTAPVAISDPPSSMEIPAPTEAPAPDSSESTDVPGTTESTDALVDSGAVNMMASTGAMIVGVTSFVLGWYSMTL